MKLDPVESSHIAAVGYLEAERVLLVRYKDGSLYAGLGWTPVLYENLMRAPSKGKALKAFAGPWILITKGGNAEDSQSTRAAPPLAVMDQSGPLNVIDEDASPCCRSKFAEMVACGINQTPAAECVYCGTRFLPEKIGECIYWRIIPQVAIVRPRR